MLGVSGRSVVSVRESGSCLWLVGVFSFLTFFSYKCFVFFVVSFVWIVCFQLFAGKYDDSKHDGF